jgi:glyoxylase-like metal-dependent hydrolase (beta-lactamase superfamily II)
VFRELVRASPVRLARLRDRLELIGADYEVVPGIQVFAAPGHTPGYSIVVVSSAGQKLMCIGDLIRDAKDIENDSWYSAFDYDPVQVVKTQQLLLAQATAEQMLVMASHVPFPGLGHVGRRERGWRWTTLETVNERG